MPVIIPPSPRPLLLWLAVAAVCAAMLTLEGLTLLTLWRRPSRPWRLGLAALMVGALGIALAGRILATYHQLAFIGVCYSAGCVEWFPVLTNAITVSLALGGLLAVLTGASVVAALALSAVDSANRRLLSSLDTSSLGGRVAALSFFTLVADAGMYWTVDGIANWIQFAYLANLQAAGDGIGQIPFIFAIMETIGGVVVLGICASLLRASLQRGDPQSDAT